MTPEQRREALLEWYRHNQRELPWRGETDPYPVLVSEVMLQQTQVNRVMPVFGRFIERYPTVTSLAAARLPDVLAAWSGLGFNRRAARLHEAAKVIDTGGWPKDVEELRRLPGVGHYTAAALASFAFGQDVATVDTNHRRVLSRWYGEPLEGRQLQRAADEQLPSGSAADWNQALMDLAAAVCRPRPRCHECPVAAGCADPEIYQVPRSQGAWEGSSRQARGAVMKALVNHGSLSLDQLDSLIDTDRERLEAAVVDLESDGLVATANDVWTLAN